MVRRSLFRSVFLASIVMVVSLSAVSAASSQKPVPDGWPKMLGIPSIGIRAPVESVPFSRAADQKAPYKWGDVAWYNRGPRPGDPGRSQVYGHLDSDCCPAVFYRLRALRPGMTVTVQYKQGKPLAFKVRWQALFWNNKLPTSFMYHATSERGLLLITCAGAFHRDGTGYDHKLIVYATLVMPPGHNN